MNGVGRRCRVAVGGWRLACSVFASAALVCGASVGAMDSSCPGDPCARCGWQAVCRLPPVSVRSVGGLFEAVKRARPGATILLADGEYRLPRILDIPTPGVTLRSRTGNRDAVVLRGGGMTEQQVGVAVSVSAADITLADLTIGWVRYHAVQVRGERAASRVTLHNVHLLDTGQQLLKGSTARNNVHADDGLVACSLIEYSDSAPSDYTNGVDVLAGRGWTVRDNVLRQIRGPGKGSAGPAILFWVGSERIMIERNLVIDSFRGIALGLKPQPAGFDAKDSSIVNNVVVNLQAWGDEGIEANAAPNTRIDHNTVLMDGTLPWSISVRFGGTTAQVRNNLTNRSIVLRNGGEATRTGNVVGARPDWFLAPAGADLRLQPGVEGLRGSEAVPEVDTDFDGRPRPKGADVDPGAFQRPS
jgi:hypothetical protein